jgi:hypothetical protein
MTDITRLTSHLKQRHTWEEMLEFVAREALDRCDFKQVIEEMAEMACMTALEEKEAFRNFAFGWFLKSMSPEQRKQFHIWNNRDDPPDEGGIAA